MASLLFGIVVKDLDELYSGIYNLLRYNFQEPGGTRVQIATVLVWLLIFSYFRHIHGYYALETWAQKHGAIFNRFSNRMKIVGIVTLPLVLMILPFLAAHKLSRSLQQIEAAPEWYTFWFWLAYLAFYLFWDLYAWVGVQVDDDHAQEFHCRVTTWLKCDAVSVLCILALVLLDLNAHRIKQELDPLTVMSLLALNAVLVITYDYVSNKDYYFDL